MKKHQRKHVFPVDHKAGRKRPGIQSTLKELLFSKHCLWFIILILFAFSLNQIERTWGLTGFSSWQPDTIEGYRTAGRIDTLFKEWKDKYPRGHFLVNWPFYRSMIDHWQKNPITFTDSDQKVRQTVLNIERFQSLASVSRWIVTVMSLGTTAAVFLAAWLLFGDYLSAWLAGFIFASSCLFVFYSSFGHIDVPFTFWYAWAICFCLLAIRRDSWFYYIAAALTAAYAVCTKEGYSMYIVGLALAYGIFKSAQEYEKTRSIRSAVVSVFSLKALTTVVVFAGLFLLMSGFLGGAAEFKWRIDFMSNEPMFKTGRTQLSLLKTSFKWLYTAVGWPVLLAWFCGLVYLLLKNKKAMLFAVVPIFVFYILTVARLHFTVARYFVPACVSIALVTGHVLACWLQTKRIPSYARYAVVIAVCILTVLYSAGLKLEMKQDTRIRAEQWVRDNVDKKTYIGAGMYERYGPRLSYEGYKVIWEWHSEGVRMQNKVVPIFPDYLIVSRTFPTSQTYKDDREYKEKLYAGQAGYKQVADFKAKYFYPSASLFGIAAWPYKPDMPDEFISPDIAIFKKNKP